MKWSRFGIGIMAVSLAAFVAVTVGSGGMAEQVAAAPQSAALSGWSSASVTIDIGGGAKAMLFDMIDQHAGIVSPRDSASGLPTGKRQHKPIVIRKRIHKSTPLLMKALIGNQVLPSVVIQMPLTVDSAFRVQLTNVSLIAIEHDPDEDGMPMESLSLNYEKIEWTYVQRGHEPISAGDQIY